VHPVNKSIGTPALEGAGKLQPASGTGRGLLDEKEKGPGVDFAPVVFKGEFEIVKQIRNDSSHVFVCFRLPEAIRTKLSELSAALVKDRADPEDVDHVTVLYVPSDDEIAEEVASKAAERATEALKELEPVKARLQGWGYFDGAEKAGERSTALVALLDAPGLAEAHVALKAALTEAGLPADEQTHGYVPHATLAYLEAGERIENLPELGHEFEINELELVHGETYTIPFGRVEKADPRSDTPWNPSHVEDRPTDQLVLRHWDLHHEFKRLKWELNRPTSAVVNEHARVVDELFRRGVKHPAPPDNGLDDFSEDFEEHEGSQPDWTSPDMRIETEKRVDPNPGVFASPGGKARFSEKLVGMLPVHSTYVEPFAGGAAVLFKKEPADVEVINDLDESIAQAYKDIKAITNAELDKIKGKDWVGKRDTFRRLHKTQPSNRVDRLYRFLYISFFSYGSTRGKGYNPVRDGRNAAETIAGRIERGRKRLKGVRILCGDYADAIKPYDGKKTVFFLDPPYAGYCADLGEGKFDEEKFVDVLRNLKGKFVLTYGARSKLMAKLRKAGFLIKRVAYPRTGLGMTSFDEQGNRRTDLSTLVVSNFEIKKKAELEEEEEVFVDVTDEEIAELEKQDPGPEAPRRFTIHRHWTGEEVHVDLRIEKGNLLEGWSLEQEIDVVDPVETLAAAKSIEDDWLQAEHVAAVRKALHPRKWLDAEGATKPGEDGQHPIGGDDTFPGVFHIVEKGLAEVGAVKPWFRELWLHGEHGRCRLLLKQSKFPISKARHSRSVCMADGCKRAPEVDVLWADGRGRAWFCKEHLETWKQGFKDRGEEGLLEIVGEKKITAGEVPAKWADVHKCVDVVVVTKEIPSVGEGSEWVASRPVDSAPYVLGSEAVETGWIPPAGISALPAGVRKQIPAELRYWEKRNAAEIRDQLVEAIEAGEVKVSLAKRIDMIDSYLEVPIQKVDTDKRLVTGVVLEPDEVDAQGDTIDAGAIERAAHNFLAKYNKETEIGNLHKIFGQNGLELVESWIAPVDMTLGKGKVKLGTWLMTIRVLNDHTWQQVKTGEITGLSIGGTASVV
jgi:site-specific DNA-adenine methylase/2'-5' RNA ligase